MAHDPMFFTRVDQFAVEVHLSRAIGGGSRENVLNYGNLLALLHRSGHVLQHSYVLHCSEPDRYPENLGVRQEFVTTGYWRQHGGGGNGLWDGKRRGDGVRWSERYPTDGHCHNYLFARVAPEEDHRIGRPMSQHRARGGVKGGQKKRKVWNE